jgi:hypothetical protein
MGKLTEQTRLHEFYILHYEIILLKTSCEKLKKKLQIYTTCTERENLFSSFCYYFDNFNTFFKILIKYNKPQGFIDP